ncbi:MAG: hypothetical protein WCJ50_02370 [Actinomycetes bacterium]
MQIGPCAAGQQPTQSVPCIPSSSGGQGGNQGGSQGGNQGGSQGGSQDMPPCEKGQYPTATKRCLIQPCEAGQQPSNTAPCIPSSSGGQGGGGQGGGGQGGGGDQAGGAPMSQPPPSEMNNKTFVMNVEVEGSGDDPGTFAASYVAIIRGVAKKTRDIMNDEMEGESLILDGTKAKCFADTTRDKDKEADDILPCKRLSDFADNIAGSVNATFTGKMKFDKATFTPSFIATKIVILKKSFKY